MSGESTVMPPRKLHDADVVYLYDGSFEGFLCCVFESFAQHEIPFAVWTPQRETATLYPVRDIETDSARAQRVFSALGRKLGRETEWTQGEGPVRGIGLRLLLVGEEAVPLTELGALEFA